MTQSIVGETCCNEVKLWGGGYWNFLKSERGGKWPGGPPSLGLGGGGGSRQGQVEGTVRRLPSREQAAWSVKHNLYYP